MAMVRDRAFRWRLWAAHAGLIAFVLLVTFPLLMIISISFRSGNFALGELIPSNPSLEHWKLALGIPYVDAAGKTVEPPFPVLLWLWNSIKIAAVSAALIVVLSTTCAYAFSRMRFAGKDRVLNSLLIIQMFPAVLALVAIYAIFDTLGEYVPWLGIDTPGAVILANAGFIALHIWTIKGYFDTIDPSMEESAIVDGATAWQAFRLILLPMSLPILMVVFVLAFIGAIIEYPIASILLQKQETMTLAVGSQLYLNPQNYLWGDFAAAAVLSGLPITIVFLICQRWIVSGLTAGGVKG